MAIKLPLFVKLFGLLLIFCCSLPGCTGSETEKIIRFGIYNVPVTLDPRYATDAVSSRINRLLYERLVDFDQQYFPKPALATWQQLSLTHYRFHLTKQSIFHHGKPLDMADVKATYEDILNAEKVSPHRGALKHIQKITLLDDKTLDFHLSRADPLFPSFLIMSILPKDLIEAKHPFNTQPVGSGTFSFQDWPYDSLLRLKRNRDNQKFDFVAVKDPTVRVLKLLHGEIDILQNNLAAEQIDFLKKRLGINFLEVDGSNYSYIGFNLQDPSIADAKIRQAIAYAIDRDAIIQYVLGGAATKANGFFPEHHWVADKELMGYEYNPDLARKILAEFGYTPQNPLKLVFKSSSNPFSIRKATIIQDQLHQVGIDISIRSYDWGTFYGDIKKGKFQLYSLEWVGIKSPDIFNYVFHSQSVPPKGANRGRLLDAKIDAMIEMAGKADSVPKMQNLYARLQKKINHILPYVSLWYMANISFFRNNIDGYILYSDGIYDGLNYVEKY